jgi:hypothetical protein
MDLAHFYIKQAFHEPVATKKQQMFCNAIHYLKNEATQEATFLLAHCYRHTGKYKKAIKMLHDIDCQTEAETTCKNVILAMCHLGNHYSGKALSCLNSCKLGEDKFIATVQVAWASYHKYNYGVEIATSFCITALKNIYLQKGCEDDMLFYIYAVNEQELLRKIITNYPDVRERIKLYRKNGSGIVPECDVVAHEYLNKYTIVTECRECGEQKSCTPYGCKYYCCLTCKMELQNGIDVEKCYKKCQELHPELTYPAISDIMKYKEKSAEKIDWEIIYAGLRKNKKLIHQIKSFGNWFWQTFEEYEKECNERMICQMFCLIGFYYDMHDKNDLEIQALKLSIEYGKMIKNHGVLVKINIFLRNYQYVIDNFTHILDDDYLGTSAYILHQFACCYCKLNDFQNATKYNKMVLLQNGHCISDCSIKDVLEAVMRRDGKESYDDLILQYFNSGKVTHMQCIKQTFKHHYPFWKILEQTTNTHRNIKKELEKNAEHMRQAEKLKTNECIICYEEENEMLPMNCGHWYCMDCLKTLKCCAYRCDTKPTKN